MNTVVNEQAKEVFALSQAAEFMGPGFRRHGSGYWLIQSR